MPGDIVVGDEDGVILVPRSLAHGVASDAVEQERMEGFLAGLIAEGRPLVGTYPPGEETLREYEAWKAGQGT